MTHHVTGPYREKSWPFQWIAMCSCRRGIRCNSEQDATAFIQECVQKAHEQPTPRGMTEDEAL